MSIIIYFILLSLSSILSCTPDSTSTISCASTTILLNTNLACTITSLQSSSPCTATCSDFILSVIPETSGNTGFCSANVNIISFTFRATEMGEINIDNGVSASSFTLYGIRSPDSTSTISCIPTSIIITSGTTTCTIIPKVSSSIIYTTNSYFTFSDGSDGQFNWNPLGTPAVTSLSFVYTAATTSASITINNGLSSTSVIVYDTPDATSTFTCSSSVILVSTTTTCTIIPKKLSAIIYALSSAFTIAPGGGVATALINSPTNSYTFTYTAGTNSGTYIISNGVSSTTFLISISDSPDSTSTFVCTATTLLLGTTMTCTTIAKKSNVDIVALSSSFTFSGAGGGTFESPATFGNSFVLTFTAVISGQYVIGNGISTTRTVRIRDTFDSTSLITCNSWYVFKNTDLICTFNAKKASTSVYTFNSFLAGTANATDSDGSSWFGFFTPSFSQSFSFVMHPTGNSALYAITISPAPAFLLTVVDTPDSTSLFSCSNNVVLAGSTLICTTTPRLSSTIIYSFNSSFSSSISPSAANIFFSFISPYLSSIPLSASSSSIALSRSTSILGDSYYSVSNSYYSILYSLSGYSGVYTLSNGVSSLTTNITVCAVSDSTTILTSNNYFISINDIATLTIVPKLNAATIYSFATDFTLSSTFSYYYFASSCVACTANSLSSVSPGLFSNSFTSTLTAGNESGNYSISAGIGNMIFVVVYDTPDSTSTFDCSSTTVSIGSTLSCTLTPHKNSRRIYCLPGQFTLNANGGGSFSSIGTEISAIYIVTFTPSLSGQFTLSDGVSAIDLTVFISDIPDSTSIVVCDSLTVAIATSLSCAFIPKRDNVLIWALKTAYNSNFISLDATPYTSTSLYASFSALSMLYNYYSNAGVVVASQFNFTLTTFLLSDSVRVFDGIGLANSALIYILGVADSTSSVYCSSNLAVSSSITCLFSAKSSLAPIYILKSTLVLSLSPSNSGTISSISPSFVSKNFTFTLTSSSTSQPVILSSNFGDPGFLIYVTDVPDSTSLFQCNSTNALVGSIISCTSTFKRNNEFVYNSFSTISYVTYPSITLTLVPSSYSSNFVNFNFTSNFISTLSNGIISTISDSIASSYIQIFIYDIPDSTSILNCSFSNVLVSQNLSCSAKCKKSNSDIFCLNTNFEPVHGSPVSFYTSKMVNGSNSHTFTSNFIDSIFNFYFSSSSSYLYALDLATSVQHFSVIVYDIPDSTTITNCTSVSLSVSSTISCYYYPFLMGNSIYSIASYFSSRSVICLSGCIGTASISPPLTPIFDASRYFLASFSSGSVSDIYRIYSGIDGAESVDIIVDDIPDSTSTIVCNVTYVYSTDKLLCHLFPRKAGIPVYTYSSSYSLSFSSPASFSVSLFSSVYISSSNLPTKNFTVLLSVGTTSSIYYFNDGVSNSAFQFTLLAVPDSTSELTCNANNLVSINSNLSCYIVPRLDNFIIYTMYSHFTLTLPDESVDLLLWPASISPISPSSFSNNFTFYLTSFNQSVVVKLYDSVSPFIYFTIYAYPDSTSFFDCNSTYLFLSTGVSCNIITKRNYVPIYSLTSFLNPLLINNTAISLWGSTSTIAPSIVSENFTFTFFANFLSGIVLINVPIVNDALSFTLTIVRNPGSTSLITCSSNVLKVNDLIHCIFSPSFSNVGIYSLPSSVNLMIPLDSQGLVPSISNLSPNSPSPFFLFTISSYNYSSAFIISEINSGVSFSFIVWDVPDSNSILICNSYFVYINTNIYCNISSKNFISSPRLIYTFASNFSIVSTVGSTTALSPFVSTSQLFTFTFTAGSNSLSSFINNSISTVFPIVVIDYPDSTSIFTCERNYFANNETIYCQIFPKKSGNSIYIVSSLLTITSSPAIYGGLSFYGNYFNFSLTSINALSGNYSLSDGVSSSHFFFYIVDTPDQTSIINCTFNYFYLNHAANCTFIPKRNNFPVFMLLSTVNINWGYLKPHSSDIYSGFGSTYTDQWGLELQTSTHQRSVLPASSFWFTLYVGNVSTLVTISELTSQASINITFVTLPDSTSTLSCESTNFLVSTSTSCSIVTRFNNIAVYTLYSSFLPINIVDALSISGATANLISNDISDIFYILVTALVHDGYFNISTQYTTPYPIIVADTPDGSSIIDCDQNFVETLSSLICYLRPMKLNVPIIAFNYSNSLSLVENFPPLPGFSQVGGYFSTIYPLISYNFTFIFTAGYSDLWHISDGHSINDYFIKIYDTPDNSSILTCESSFMSVYYYMPCHISPKKLSLPIYSLSSSFSMSVYNADSGDSYGIGNFTFITNVDYYFTIIYNSSLISSSYFFSTNISNSVNVITYDIPDGTSFINCVSRTIPVRSVLNCTLYVRKTDTVIYSLASAFLPTITPSSDGTFDPISTYNDVGKTLPIIYRTGFSSGHHFLSDGVSSASFEFFITDIPDGTASVSCLESILFVGVTTICTLSPKLNSVSIYSFNTDFSPLALPLNAGNFSSVSPFGVNSTFFVSFTASNISQKIQIVEGFTASPFLITVIDQPDNTSVLSCNQQYARVGSTFTCTLSPRLNSVSIFTTPSYFSLYLNQYLDSNLTSNDLSTSRINFENVVLRGNSTGSNFGYFSPATPVLGDLFQFIVYVPTFDGAFSISSSIGIEPYLFLVYNTSDSTSTITCEYPYVIIRNSIFCKLLSKIVSNRAFAISSSYLFTVNYTSPDLIGSFSTSLLQHPYVAQEFTFDWTAKAITGPWKIIDSLTGSFASVFVLAIPDLTSFMVCPTYVFINSNITCSLFPSYQSVSIPTLATYFSLSIIDNLNNNLTSLVGTPDGYGSFFTFKFISGAVSETDFISNGVTSSSTKVTITDIPDTTSSLTCPFYYIGSRQTMTCTIFSRKANISIFSYPEYFGVLFSAETAGTSSSLSPAYPSTSFSFTYRAGIVPGVFSLFTNVSLINSYFVNITVDQSCIIVDDLEHKRLACLDTYLASLSTTDTTCISQMNSLAVTCGFDNFTMLYSSPPSYSSSNFNSTLLGFSCSSACATSFISNYASCIIPLGTLHFSLLSPSPWSLISFADYFSSCSRLLNPLVSQVPLLDGAILSNGLTCNDELYFINKMCGIYFNGINDLITAEFCSKDCSVLWAETDFFAKCLSETYLPFANSTRQTELLSFHKSCANWYNCSSYSAPISLYDMACAGSPTCRTTRDISVSTVCPTSGLILHPESLPTTFLWPSSDILSMLPDVCTSNCSSSYLSYYSDCLQTEIPLKNETDWYNAIAFRKLCNFPRDFPAGLNCTLKEKNVVYFCDITYIGRNFLFSNPNYCSYDCADVYLPFFNDCFQYDYSISNESISFNNTCYTMRRRPPDGVLGFHTSLTLDNSASMMWLQPKSLGTPVLFFNVSYSKNYYSAQIWENIYIGSNLFYSASNLDYNTTYAFRILAHTSLGDSKWSEIKFVTTLVQPPSAPLNVTASINSSFVSVSFTVPLSEYASLGLLSYSSHYALSSRRRLLSAATGVVYTIYYRVEILYSYIPNSFNDSSSIVLSFWTPACDTTGSSCIFKVISGSSFNVRVSAKYLNSAYGSSSSVIASSSPLPLPRNVFNLSFTFSKNLSEPIFSDFANDLLSNCVLAWLPPFFKDSIHSYPYDAVIFEIEFSIINPTFGKYIASNMTRLKSELFVYEDSPFYLQIAPFAPLYENSTSNFTTWNVLDDYIRNGNYLFLNNFNTTSLSSNLSPILSFYSSCVNKSSILDLMRSTFIYFKIRPFRSNSNSYGEYTRILLAPGKSTPSQPIIKVIYITNSTAEIIASCNDDGNLVISTYLMTINCTSCISFPSPRLALGNLLKNTTLSYTFSTTSPLFNFRLLPINSSFALSVIFRNQVGWSTSSVIYFATFSNSPYLTKFVLMNNSTVSKCEFNTSIIYIEFSQDLNLMTLNPTESYPYPLNQSLIEYLFIFSPTLDTFYFNYSGIWLDKRSILLNLTHPVVSQTLTGSLWDIIGSLTVKINSFSSIQLRLTDYSQFSFPMLGDDSKLLLMGDSCSKAISPILSYLLFTSPTFANNYVSFNNLPQISSLNFNKSDTNYIGLKFSEMYNGLASVDISQICNLNSAFSFCFLKCVTSNEITSSTLNFVGVVNSHISSFNFSFVSNAITILYESNNTIVFNLSASILSTLIGDNSNIFIFKYYSDSYGTDYLRCELLIPKTTTILSDVSYDYNLAQIIINQLTYLNEVFELQLLPIYITALNISSSTFLLPVNNSDTMQAIGLISTFNSRIIVNSLNSLSLNPIFNSKSTRTRINIKSNYPAVLHFENSVFPYNCDISYHLSKPNINFNTYYEYWNNLTSSDYSIPQIVSLLSSIRHYDSNRLNSLTIEGDSLCIESIWSTLSVFVDYDPIEFSIYNISLNGFNSSTNTPFLHSAYGSLEFSIENFATFEVATTYLHFFPSCSRSIPSTVELSYHWLKQAVGFEVLFNIKVAASFIPTLKSVSSNISSSTLDGLYGLSNIENFYTTFNYSNDCSLYFDISIISYLGYSPRCLISYSSLKVFLGTNSTILHALSTNNYIVIQLKSINPLMDCPYSNSSLYGFFNISLPDIALIRPQVTLNGVGSLGQCNILKLSATNIYGMGGINPIFHWFFSSSLLIPLGATSTELSSSSAIFISTITLESGINYNISLFIENPVLSIYSPLSTFKFTKSDLSIPEITIDSENEFILSSFTFGNSLVFQSVLTYSDCNILDNQRLIYSWKLYLMPSSLALSNNRSLENCELNFNYFDSNFAYARLSLPYSSFITSVGTTDCSGYILNTYLSNANDIIIENLHLMAVVRVGYQSDVSLKSMSSKTVSLKSGNLIPVIFATLFNYSVHPIPHDNILIEAASDDIRENSEFYIDASFSYDMDILNSIKKCDLRDYSLLNISSLKKFALMYPALQSYVTSPIYSDCFSFTWECISYLAGNYNSPVSCYDKTNLLPLNITSYVFNNSSIMKFPAFTFSPGNYLFKLKLLKGFKFALKSFNLNILPSNFPIYSNVTFHTLSVLNSTIFTEESKFYVYNDRPLYLESTFFTDCGIVNNILASWTFSPSILNSSVWVKPLLSFQSTLYSAADNLVNFTSIGSEFSDWILISTSNITLRNSKCFVNLTLQINFEKLSPMLESSDYFNISSSVFIWNELNSIATSKLLIPHKLTFGSLSSFPSYGLSFKTPFTFTINELGQENDISKDYIYQFYLLSKSLPNMFWSSWTTTQYEYSLYTFSDISLLPIFPISAESDYLNLYDVNYRIPLSQPSSFPFATFKLPAGLLAVEGCVSSRFNSPACFITTVFVADNSQTYFNESLASVISDTKKLFNNTLTSNINLDLFASTSSNVVDKIYDLFSANIIPSILVPYLAVPVGQVLSYNIFTSRNDLNNIYSLSNLDTSSFSSLSLFKLSLMDSFTYSSNANFNRAYIILEDEILSLVSNWNITKDSSIYSAILFLLLLDSLFLAMPNLIMTLNSRSGSLLKPTLVGVNNYNYVDNLAYSLKLRKKLLSGLIALISSASYVQFNLYSFLSSLNSLMSATFILDESFLKSVVSILHYLLCSSSFSNFNLYSNYCLLGFDPKSYLSSMINSNPSSKNLKVILLTFISIVDKIHMAIVSLPYTSKSISSSSELFLNQSFPFLNDFNTNNTMLAQSSFSRVLPINLDLNCYPPISQTPPPDLPNALSLSQLDLIFNLHSIFPAFQNIISSNPSKNYFLFSECSSSSIACIFQKQQFGIFFNRTVISRGYDGPSSRVPPTLVTWPLVRSSVSFSISEQSQKVLHAIASMSQNASIVFNAFKNMNSQDRLNSNFVEIVSNTSTLFDNSESLTVQLFYSPASYYANSSLAFSSVLSYLVKLPKAISPPTNGNWSDIIDNKSPYAPIFDAAKFIEPIIVTFLIDPLDCIPPTCFLTCYSLPAPSNHFDQYYNGTLSVSSNVVWMSNDKINGGNWSQILTNITTQKFDTCSYLIKVICTLPIFPILSSDSISLKNEQGFLPRLSGSIVVMKSLVDSNLIPTIAPVLPISPGEGANLALILGLTIPFGFLFLVIVSYLIYYFYFKNEVVSNDQISLFDSSQKNDVGDEGIEMFQKRKINKSDLTVRDELKNQSVQLIVQEDKELSLSEKSKASITILQNDSLNVESINVSRTSTPDLRDIAQPPGLVQGISLLATLDASSSPYIDQKLNIVPVNLSIDKKHQELSNVYSTRANTPPKNVSSTATTRFTDRLFSKFIPKNSSPSLHVFPTSVSSKLTQDPVIEDLDNDEDDDSDLDQYFAPKKSTLNSELALVVPPEFNSSLIIDMDKLESQTENT